MIEKYNGTSDSFYPVIAKCFSESIEGRYVEIFKSLNIFLHDRLIANYQNNDIDRFSSFSNLFVYYYEYSVKNYRISISSQEFHDTCSDYAVRYLKEIIIYKFRFANDDSTLQEKQKNNKYSEVLLYKLSDIIYISIKHKDFKQLKKFLNQLHQVYKTNSYEYQNKKFEISSLKDSSYDLNLEEQGRLKFLEEALEVDSYTDDIVRKIFKVIRFWTYFLYDIEILSYDDIKEVDNAFEQYNVYIESEQLDDLYYLRATSYSEDTYWRNWDYMERPDGEVYTPPSVLHWITFGAFIYFVRNDGAIRYNYNDTNPQHIKSFEYLISSFADILQSLSKNGYEKWHAILNTPSKDLFEKRIQSFKGQIDYLQQVNITSKERTIADIPLDESLINKFKNVIEQSWQKRNPFRELFNYFNNIENSIDKKVDYVTHGDLGIIKEDWKKSFIANPEFHVSIGNVGSYGYQLSKIEERDFVRQVMDENKNIIKEPIEGINDALQNLKKKNYNPSIILMSHNIWVSYFSKLKHSDFEFDANKKNKYGFSEFGGAYKKLPILPIRTEIFKGDVIVADFIESFWLDQYTENQNSLIIKVNPISTEDAKKNVNENLKYWQLNGLSDEQAIIKIRNAIKLDFYTCWRIRLKHREAFEILTFE